jgi:hypothetical protein
MKVVIHQDDGAEDDITEAVRILWDIADKSMDHGSRFLSSEEEAILKVTGCLLRTKDAVWTGRRFREPTDEEVQSARRRLVEVEQSGTVTE